MSSTTVAVPNHRPFVNPYSVCSEETKLTEPVAVALFETASVQYDLLATCFEVNKFICEVHTDSEEIKQRVRHIKEQVAKILCSGVDIANTMNALVFKCKAIYDGVTNAKELLKYEGVEVSHVISTIETPVNDLAQLKLAVQALDTTSTEAFKADIHFYLRNSGSQALKDIAEEMRTKQHAKLIEGKMKELQSVVEEENDIASNLVSAISDLQYYYSMKSNAENCLKDLANEQKSIQKYQDEMQSLVNQTTVQDRVSSSTTRSFFGLFRRYHQQVEKDYTNLNVAKEKLSDIAAKKAIVETKVAREQGQTDHANKEIARLEEHIKILRGKLELKQKVNAPIVEALKKSIASLFISVGFWKQSVFCNTDLL